MKIFTLITAALLSLSLSTACHHSKSSSDNPAAPPSTTSVGEQGQVTEEGPASEGEKKIAALSENSGCLPKHATISETLADAGFMSLLKTIVGDASSPEAQKVAEAIKSNTLACP